MSSMFSSAVNPEMKQMHAKLHLWRQQSTRSSEHASLEQKYGVHDLVRCTVTSFLVGLLRTDLARADAQWG